MKVDMSSEAVSMRLDAMGELWELSVALMDSTRTSAVASSDTDFNTASKLPWKSLFIITGLGSAILGCLLAYSVTSEPIAYIASMSHGIIVLFLIAPVVFVLLCMTIAAAAFQKFRLAMLFLLAMILLPLSYFAFLGSAQALGMAPHKDDEVNQMRPIDEEPNGNVIILYTSESTFEQQEEFLNRVVHSYKKDHGFTGETGTQSLLGLRDIDGKTAQKIFFRASATEQQKDKLRMGLQASPIIYRYFENLNEWQVRAKFETKKDDRK